MFLLSRENVIGIDCVLSFTKE